jgi:hypothetical protein
MRQQFEIKYPTREYTLSNGEKKTFWTTHGSIWVDEDKKSMSVKIDSLPVGDKFTGYFKAFPYVPKNQQKQKPNYDGLPADEDFNDTPF